MAAAVVPTLHHRPEIENIRHAYDSDRSLDRNSQRSVLPSRPSHSGSEKSSYRTQPSSIYSTRSPPRLPRGRHSTPDGHHDKSKEETVRYFDDRAPQESPHASVATYASTVISEEDAPERPPFSQLPLCRARPYEPSAMPATPSDFSELFPSHRRLLVRHDDSTGDGNMNLRVDTEVTMNTGRKCDMTLFHLRMHDLKDRDFSLRRYCRDSGREVCHTGRKPQKTSSKRPGLQRSLSNALNSMRPKSDQSSTTTASLKRNDSAYSSAHSSLDDSINDRPASADAAAKTLQSFDTNSIKLEFSNYAHVDVKRVGMKTNKRYEYEYWGEAYAWRRTIQRETQYKQMSYHLTKGTNDRALAYIIPSPLAPAEADEERSKGGWIPPCSMWIDDESLVRGQKDIADVVIASGLIALVDDSIRTQFHSKHVQQLVIPKLGVDIGPKRLISEMFRRESSGQNSRRSSTSRPSTSRPSSMSGQPSPKSRTASGVARRPSNGW